MHVSRLWRESGPSHLESSARSRCRSRHCLHMCVYARSRGQRRISKRRVATGSSGRGCCTTRISKAGPRRRRASVTATNASSEPALGWGRGLAPDVIDMHIRRGSRRRVAALDRDCDHVQVHTASRSYQSEGQPARYPSPGSIQVLLSVVERQKETARKLSCLDQQYGGHGGMQLHIIQCGVGCICARATALSRTWAHCLQTLDLDDGASYQHRQHRRRLLLLAAT
jgi:hypothetical protein